MQLSPFIKDTVARAGIMVAGCGALGNEVIKNLALLGVGRILAVDFDSVERENLCKSVLFTEEDVRNGRRKTDAVKDAVHRLNPDVGISTIFGDIATDVGLALWKEYDVVISCVDSRWARYCINRNCMRTLTPWVDGGIMALEGTVRVFAHGRNCYACNLGPAGLDELRRRMPCPGVVRRNERAGRAATTVLSASIIAAVQVQEALKLLHGKDLEEGRLTSLCGRMFSYEGENLTTGIADFKAWDEDCPCHEVWDVEGRADIGAGSTVGEALDRLKNLLRCDDVAIVLRDDCFVDYVERRCDGRKYDVMVPGRRVEERLEEGPLCGLASDALYQHEWRSIGGSFPYRDMTLAELGIPPRDILHLTADGEDRFIEMN